jgi:hypothetical protein
MGGTHNWFEDNNMKFEFLVSDYSGSWRKPLYWVRGNYKVITKVGKSMRCYKITVDTYKIEPFDE